MRRSFVPVLTGILLCMASGVFAQSSFTYSKETQARIAQVENKLLPWITLPDTTGWTLLERMKTLKVPGLSIAVIKDFAIDWAKGYGWADVSEQRPVTTETRFQAASISKSLNAVGVLKMVQDKKIGLYDDINNYLSTWKFPYDSLSANKKISIANLLSHTAGLTIHGFPGYAKGDTLPALSQILNGARPANTLAVRSQYAPGLKYEYSGGGTTILQRIILDNNPYSYDEYMWRMVLQPIGMTNSTYRQPPPPDLQNMLATAYEENGSELKGKYHIYPEQAAAGLWTTPTDLAKFIIEMQLSAAGRSNKVLSKEMTATMLNHYVDSTVAFGNFIVRKGANQYFSHSGANEGFRALYYGSLDGNGVVVMVNSNNGSIMNEVISSVANAYGWKDFYTPVVQQFKTPPTDSLQAYAGDYTIEGDSISFERQGNRLLIKGRDNAQLYFTSASDFMMYDSRTIFNFVRNGNGLVTGFLVNRKTFVKKIN